MTPGYLVTAAALYGALCLLGAVLVLIVKARNGAGATAPSTRSGGTGRAILRARRIALDARAVSRGPAAYGRRVARRSAFRAVSRWR